MNPRKRNPRVFLISPARIGGPRSNTLLRREADFDLAIRLRNGRATLGEAYSFISGLYFRGKMAYVEAFAAPPMGAPPALIIVPSLGLVPPHTMFDAEQLRSTGSVPIKESNPAFTVPLLRDAAILDWQTALTANISCWVASPRPSTHIRCCKSSANDCFSRASSSAVAI